MIIVLDSNIWLSELGLNSSLGAATRFYIRHNGACLALPEVVRLEVEQNFRSHLKDFTKKISKGYRQLLVAFGALKELVLPSDDEIDKKVKEIFTNVGLDLIEIPFALESARSSFLKTIAKLPPSNGTQQFKDGVLWADCCRLLEVDDVCLVTSDTAFYADRKYVNGLATNLIEEISGAKHKLGLFASLPDLLKDLKRDVVLDIDALVEAFLREHKTSVEGTLSRNGFELGQQIGVSKTLYATERPDALYLTFRVEFACDDISGEGRSDGKLLLKGDGSYNTSEQAFTDLRNWGEELSFRLRDGEERVSRNTVIGIGSIVLGHKEVVHTVRYELR